MIPYYFSPTFSLFLADENSGIFSPSEKLHYSLMLGYIWLFIYQFIPSLTFIGNQMQQMKMVPLLGLESGNWNWAVSVLLDWRGKVKKLNQVVKGAASFSKLVNLSKSLISEDKVKIFN